MENIWITAAAYMIKRIYDNNLCISSVFGIPSVHSTLIYVMSLEIEYSNGEPLYIRITYAAYPFDVQVKWQLTTQPMAPEHAQPLLRILSKLIRIAIGHITV